MKKVNVLLISLLVLLSGCESTEYMDFADTQVPIEVAETSFSAAGGFRLIVAGISDYEVTSSKSWCKVTADDELMTVTVEPNKSVSGRSSLLTIRSGKKVNYIPINQTGVVLRLDTYTWDAFAKGDEIRIGYECDFTPDVAGPSWLELSVDALAHEVVITAPANPSYLESRTATVRVYVDDGNGAEMAPAIVTVTQDKNFLEYEDYLGDYTMYYTSVASATNTAPNRSLDVSLVAGDEENTYYLRGILPDELGNIVVSYDPVSGNITTLGRIIGKYPDTDYDIWWLPYIYSNSSPTSFYVLTGADAYGIKSVDINSSGGTIQFNMRDFGTYSGYTQIGFILRVYNGSTSIGNLNGLGGTSYFYPTFEKK